MGRGQWVPCGVVGDSDREISNVVITITDNAAVAEGQAITAVCNGKTFSSTIKNGIAKMYTSEVGTYTITAGSYNTMLVCPYFGQFSTDIYSGVLQVTCTEAGGSNKTCHVQSCDDEYNFTDSYNLTQTFDSGLVLTFMGIPTGMYLITVDDKYRFFKEIVSIQTVNESEVELKQWLYNDGDQCVHNTGGWIQCQATGTSNAVWNYNSGSIGPYNISHIETLQCISNCLRLYHNCVAIENVVYPEFGSNSHVRPDGSSSLHIGTAKHIPISFAKYSKVIINSNHSVTTALRSGEVNNSSTNAGTGTVLVSSSGSTINFTTEDTIGSMILGENYVMNNKGYGIAAWWDGRGNYPKYNGGVRFGSLGNVNETYTTDVYQIYLL